MHGTKGLNDPSWLTLVCHEIPPSLEIRCPRNHAVVVLVARDMVRHLGGDEVLLLRVQRLRGDESPFKPRGKNGVADVSGPDGLGGAGVKGADIDHRRGVVHDHAPSYTLDPTEKLRHRTWVRAPVEKEPLIPDEWVPRGDGVGSERCREYTILEGADERRAAKLKPGGRQIQGALMCLLRKDRPRLAVAAEVVHDAHMNLRAWLEASRGREQRA